MLPEQDESPVATLMSDLGINSEDSNPIKEDDSNNTVENNLSDSDTPTQMDGEKSETSEATDTAKADTDTTDEKMEQLMAEVEKLGKRISDKDKYINELKNQNKQEAEESVVQENTPEENEEVDYWTDPEGFTRKLVEQNQTLMDEIQTLKNRFDLDSQEKVYAMKNPDYYDLVNQDSINSAMQEDSSFTEGLQGASDKIAYAYNYFKDRKTSLESTKEAEEKALEAKYRKKFMEEMSANKGTVESVPSLSTLGSGSSESKASADGFAAMFG